MTKQKEIEILSAAIKQLGPDSYLGPWLTQIKAGLADLIKTDTFPDITLNDAIKSGEGIKKAAFIASDGILRAAQLKADKIEKAADAHKNSVREAIRSAQHVLDHF